MQHSLLVETRKELQPREVHLEQLMLRWNRRGPLHSARRLIHHMHRSIV
jgi:hypothetical protein